MFLGTYEPKLDEKGRLILPAKFREGLAAGIVVTKGQERCLYVWPTQEFERVTANMAQAPIAAKAARDFVRMLFSGGHAEQPDKQGRINIPAHLRTYAGLDRECTVIGANTRVEIWDTAAWNNYLAEQEPAFADLSDEVFPGLM